MAPGWYPPAYALPSPPSVQQQPQQYIEQPARRQPSDGYWYFCPSAGGYYPRVPNCSEPWMKVAPAPQ